MKKKKYLEFYEQCMNNSGMMSAPGLCDALGAFNPVLQLFEPTDENRTELQRKDLSTWYWGSGMRYDNPNRAGTFTPLRQTIVLFMAAMEGEL